MRERGKRMRILNLTQHKATPQQVQAGVVDPHDVDAKNVQLLLTFDELPSISVIERRAEQLAQLARELCRVDKCNAVMIGGAPYLMPELECALRRQGLRYCYAFSKRVAEDQPQAGGSVRKVQIFRHAGFIFKEEH